MVKNTQKFNAASDFNTAERAETLPAFPEVTIVGYKIPAATVARVFRTGIERIVSATTAPVKGDKTESIHSVLGLLSQGYLSESERDKALKPADKSGSAAAKKFFPKDEVLRALRATKQEASAVAVEKLSDTQFSLVYAKQLSTEGSKIAAAHAWLVAEAEEKAAAEAEKALKGIDFSVL